MSTRLGVNSTLIPHLPILSMKGTMKEKLWIMVLVHRLFFLLRADGADKIGVSRALAGWYLRLTDEKQVFVTLILP